MEATITTTVYEIGGDAYRVTPLDCHPEVAVAAFRFEKVGRAGVTYDVHMTPEGYTECTCPGNVYHQKPCRHIRACEAAGMFPGVAAAA